ncbi:unnamed protein product [Ascophyllum nodosum]
MQPVHRLIYFFILLSVPVLGRAKAVLSRSVLANKRLGYDNVPRIYHDIGTPWTTRRIGTCAEVALCQRHLQRLRGGGLSRPDESAVAVAADPSEDEGDVIGERPAESVRARGGSTGTSGFRVNFAWPMFSAFLYFLAIAFTIPVLPKVVNELLSGSKAVTTASATLYGILSATDASFTLMTVNFHANLSDTFGRRPFLALSALGLGAGFLITYHTRKVWMLILAAAIDGCTSCMYSIALASITDCVGTGPKLSEAFGMYQGLSLGMAFMIGLPLGGVLGAKYGVRFPLLVSVGLCVSNFLLVSLIMPETLPAGRRKEKVDLSQANPLGAMKLASRNKLITGIVACWTLMWIAHVGLQINWINYTDRKFEWGVAQSGASLALMGLMVAVFPKLIIPRLGLERSITHGLMVYSIGQLVIATAPGVKTPRASLGTPLVVAGLVMASAGAIVFPSTLAYLSNQVGESEVGALQGTADTAKTLCSVFFGPAMAWIFGYFISERAYPRQIEGANYYVGAVVALAAWGTARHTFAKHGHLDKVPQRERAATKMDVDVIDLTAVVD